MVRKFSRQRESIKRNLMERRDHPTADMVFADIRKEYPSISLGTVYRNLSLLADEGEIQKLKVLNGADHFDGNKLPHHHFICKHCGGIQDVVLPQMNSSTFTEELSGLIRGTVIDCSITFTGICEDCTNGHLS